MKKQKISLNVDIDVYDWLRMKADYEDITASQYIRKLLREAKMEETLSFDVRLALRTK